MILVVCAIINTTKTTFLFPAGGLIPTTN